jgi:hypothetical protein
MICQKKSIFIIRNGNHQPSSSRNEKGLVATTEKLLATDRPLETERLMVVVTSHTSGTRVELWCCLCRRRLDLTQAWMAFPVDAEGHEGKWVHNRCAAGRLHELFGKNRAVLMRADAALSHLATSLNYTTDE